MKRRRIIPGVMLKPFLDFRARAKALCQEMGEPYLNGFVMRRQDAAVAERALSVWRKEFCRWRDEVFAPAYEDILAQRLEGIIPPGCSKEAVFPPTNFVLRRISFEFDAFVLAAHGTGKRSSKDAFLDGLAERFADETDLICGALETANVTEAIVCRARTLYERVRSWSCSQTRFALASAALEEALAEGSRTHVWCRSKKLFVECLDKAREAFAQAGASYEQNTTEEAESLVSVPSVEERREVLTGAAGMIARGRSLFPFG